MRRAGTFAVLLFAALGCGQQMLWIGEVAPEAGTPAVPDANTPADTGAPASGRDADLGRDAEPPTDITGRIAERDGGLPPNQTAEPPRAADPPDPTDASSPPPVDDADGGALGGPGPVRPEMPTRLPIAAATCPVLSGPGIYTFGTSRRNLSARVFVAPDARNKPGPGGPLILYWHALASSANQVVEALGQAAIDDVVAKGGVVASFTSKYCSDCGGLLADDVVWYVEDDIASDHFVACALEQAKIDRRHIHTMGFSAGALRSIHLSLARSNFIASVVSFSGGDREMGMGPMQDPENEIPVIMLYGGALDTIALDFPALARQWYDSRKQLGWYTMVCNHGGGHTIPPDFGRHAYRFFLDHPYKVAPEPYAGAIPPEFPDYCGNEFR